MSDRWKGVERGVALHLSKLFSDVGMDKVERIPILGRTGPDITINQCGLVIDVKSRQVIPDRLFAAERLLMRYEGGLVGFRLAELLTFEDNELYPLQKIWKPLLEWHDWMENWTLEHEPDGASCIIIHKPNVPYGDATLIIKQSHVRRILWKLQEQKQIQSRLDRLAWYSAKVPA